MLSRRTLTLLCLFCLSTSIATAEENENLEAPPPPPELLEEKHLPPPEVKIIRRKDATIEEYRVNGQLRYAKITPVKGPPYYLIDTDGDGDLDTRRGDLSNPEVQQWILMRW